MLEVFDQRLHLLEGEGLKYAGRRHVGTAPGQSLGDGLLEAGTGPIVAWHDVNVVQVPGVLEVE